jgi:hypothetical protein
MKTHYLASTLKVILGIVLSIAVSAAEPVKSGSISIPTPPKAKESVSAEQSCVKSIEIMRRNHGLLLKHSRHKTMRQGIRDIQTSLFACINCHVTPDADGNYPSVNEGNAHFCRSCHQYAAVTIDCFQCHNSHPEEVSSLDEHSSLKNEIAPIKKLDLLGTPSTSQ